MTKSDSKYIRVSDYFSNSSDSRWKKIKVLVLKYVEQLPEFIQDATGVDLNNPLKSIKEKFNSDKKKGGVPESDSKIVGNFLPSLNILMGLIFVLSILSALAFFSPAVFLSVALPIVGIIKVNNLISSDKEKDGTIHNPIISNRSENCTKHKTLTVTYDEITVNSNYINRIKNECSKKMRATNGRSL